MPGGSRARIAVAVFAAVLPGAAARAQAPQPPEPCAYMRDVHAADYAARAQALVLRPDGAAALAAAFSDPATQALIAAQARAEAVQKAQDWAQLCYYKADDAARAGGPPVDVVMMGDSITEFWKGGDAGLFADGRVVDRGISGQTSSQALLRFHADVIALKPRAVHLMIGTNDIAGNTGPISDADVLGNVEAMVDQAQAHGVRVVLASIPPMLAVSWRPGVTPGPRVARLNAALRALSARRGLVYADYHAALADARGGLPARFSNDGVHPTLAGYAAMRPVLDRALRAAHPAPR